MPTRKVLLLGDPRLYEVSKEVRKDELESIGEVIADLHDTLMDFKERFGAGPPLAFRTPFVVLFLLPRKGTATG